MPMAQLIVILGECNFVSDNAIYYLNIRDVNFISHKWTKILLGDHLSQS